MSLTIQKKGEDRFIVYDETDTYRLHYDGYKCRLPIEMRDLLADKYFNFRVKFPGVQRLVTISARDIEGAYGKSYHESVAELTEQLNPLVQVIEVGAGLGEFTPVMAERMKTRPIVIDPADYVLMNEMLYFARDEVKIPDHIEQLDEIIRRSEIICDDAKVRLVNTTLGDALEKFPDLHGKADLVIDNYGVICWHRTEGFSDGEDAVMLVEQLLKPDGELYTERGLITSRVRYEMLKTRR